MGADPKFHLGAELAGFLGLCSCLLGSEGVFSLASPVMGPPCWQGSLPASWVCLSRKFQEGSERSCETPKRQSFLSQIHLELGGSSGCPFTLLFVLSFSAGQRSGRSCCFRCPVTISLFLIPGSVIVSFEKCYLTCISPNRGSYLVLPVQSCLLPLMAPEWQRLSPLSWERSKLELGQKNSPEAPMWGGGTRGWPRTEPRT